MDKAQKKIEQEGITCDVLEKQGKPAFVICDVADDLDVDLIVMGTKGINHEDDEEPYEEMEMEDFEEDPR